MSSPPTLFCRPSDGGDVDNNQDKSPDEDLRLDPHGLPLEPQPSQFKDDPLNWPRWLKWAVLLQVSFMAFLGPFNAAMPNPSLGLLGHVFHRRIETMAYSTTTAIIAGGVSPFVLVPLSGVLGRRPVCLATQLLTVVSHVATAHAASLPALLGWRALNGVGFGGMMAMGTPVLNDMFFLHERGAMTGVYTIFVTNGAHVAVLCGGFLGQYAGWRWDFYLPAIATAVAMVVALVALPETLFAREPAVLAARKHERTRWQLLFGRPAAHRGGRLRDLHPADFASSLTMLRYPSMALPFVFYTASWALLNILPAISMAKIYSQRYDLASGQIGLCTGLPLILGCVVGEICGGKLSDVLLYRQARRHGGVYQPEHRLHLTCLSAVFGPAGMLIFGICLELRAPYIYPLIGLGVGVIGLQITSTCLYAYVSDCYRLQTPESAVLMNLGRGLSFVVGFFWPAMVARIGFAWTWTALASVLLLLWLPILALMVWGERWRQQLGKPRLSAWSSSSSS